MTVTDSDSHPTPTTSKVEGSSPIIGDTIDHMAASDYTLNISVGKPEVDGIDPHARGLLLIRVPFEPEPNTPWREVFVEGPPGASYSASMHPPVFFGPAEVTLRCPDDEIELYISSLRERVDATNEYYNGEIAPRLRRMRSERRAAVTEEQRRLEEARKRLENL